MTGFGHPMPGVQAHLLLLSLFLLLSTVSPFAIRLDLTRLGCFWVVHFADCRLSAASFIDAAIPVPRIKQYHNEVGDGGTVNSVMLVLEVEVSVCHR
jgi:hypothetical protein